MRLASKCSSESQPPLRNTAVVCNKDQQGVNREGTLTLAVAKKVLLSRGLDQPLANRLHRSTVNSKSVFHQFVLLITPLNTFTSTVHMPHFLYILYTYINIKYTYFIKCECIEDTSLPSPGNYNFNVQNDVRYTPHLTAKQLSGDVKGFVCASMIHCSPRHSAIAVKISNLLTHSIGF